MDHSLAVHVEPSGAPRSVGESRRNRALVWGLGILGAVVGILFWGGVVFAALGGFDKDTVPQEPGSPPHRVAVELKRAGTIDEFGAVEPDEGWDVEYELDGGDGTIRWQLLGGDLQNVEYEAFPDDLETEIEAALTRRGFEFD